MKLIFDEHINSIPGVGSHRYLAGLGSSDSGMAAGLETGLWGAARGRDSDTLCEVRGHTSQLLMWAEKVHHDEQVT